MQGVEGHEGSGDERFCVFAAPSAECAKQFHDGSYFGCIALTQALLEAVIRHVSQIKLNKKPNDQASFDRSLEGLHQKKFISDDWKIKLDQMWADRHSFHYLQPSVDRDQRKLEEKARNLLELLDDLEREFFGCKRSVSRHASSENPFEKPRAGEGSVRSLPGRLAQSAQSFFLSPECLFKCGANLYKSICPIKIFLNIRSHGQLFKCI